MASYRIRAAVHHDRVSVLSKFNEIERSRVGRLRNKSNPVDGDCPEASTLRRSGNSISRSHPDPVTSSSHSPSGCTPIGAAHERSERWWL